MKTSILHFIFILFSHVGYAQWENQIPNYSFENVTIDYPSSSNINNLTNYKLDKDTAHHDKNAVFGEVFGGGGYYSVGFERTLITYDNYDLMISIGFTNNHFKKPQFSFGFPISINNRFKFLRFNGIDVGLTLGNFINIWSIIDQDKYFNCPLGDCTPPMRLLPSFHTGWVFRLNKFTISPRFMGSYTLITVD